MNNEEYKQSRTIPTHQVEAREWWLWGFAVAVTLALTACIVSLTFFSPRLLQNSEWIDLKEWVRGLACVVLLFDVYTVYQQLQLQRIRRELNQRNQLFEAITENAADMIAVVDCAGNRLYNSPAYGKVLGYSSEELRLTLSAEQIHPEDQQRVVEAAEQARSTGQESNLSIACATRMERGALWNRWPQRFAMKRAWSRDWSSSIAFRQITTQK